MATHAEWMAGRMRGEVDGLRAGAEGWLSAHEEVRRVLWTAEDCLAAFNALFARLTAFDLAVHRGWLEGEPGFGQDLADVSEGLLRDWLASAERLLPTVGQLADRFASVDGLGLFMDNVRRAKSSLTPDEEFFTPEGLAGLRGRCEEAPR